MPSIYNHYPSKTALLVAAARLALDQAFGPLADTPSTPTYTVALFPAPELMSRERAMLPADAEGTGSVLHASVVPARRPLAVECATIWPWVN